MLCDAMRCAMQCGRVPQRQAARRGELIGTKHCAPAKLADVAGRSRGDGAPVCTERRPVLVGRAVE
eukprot:603851-Rhodomonas_salina.1